jgi:hypothetical protein
LGFDLIEDVTREINSLKKIQKNKFRMMVFGLGCDSYLWYRLTDGKLLFVENDQQIINDHSEIPITHVIKYNFDRITLANSFTISDKTLNEFRMPQQFKNVAFDIILINGPSSILDTDPGKLIPIYWVTKYLSQKGSVIYLCHSDRLLENYCLHKYMNTDSYKLLSQFVEKQSATKLLRIK